jgi:hypothetical protein
MNDDLLADEVEAYLKRLRKMLYDMTSRIDWANAGYSVEEYDELCEEFEPKQG